MYDEHKSKVGSTGGLHRDLKDSETKWDLPGTSLVIQEYKVFKMAVTKTIMYSR